MTCRVRLRDWKKVPPDELRAWEAEARRNPSGPESWWHAQACFAQGLEHCPFADEAPVAREQWHWMHQLCRKNEQKRNQVKPADIGPPLELPPQRLPYVED